MTSPLRPWGPFARIVLTGFMGSGKTTVGRLLARTLQWQFADLDECVEAQEGRTVPQIFAESGEAAFRQAETAALTALLRQTEIVVALGGGAPGTAANRDLLQRSDRTALVHLHAPFATLYERCAVQALDPGATARPLLEGRAKAEARYQQRSSLYTALAPYRIDAAGSPEVVAAAILSRLGFALQSRH